MFYPVRKETEGSSVNNFLFVICLLNMIMNMSSSILGHRGYALETRYMVTANALKLFCLVNFNWLIHWLTDAVCPIKIDSLGFEFHFSTTKPKLHYLVLVMMVLKKSAWVFRLDLLVWLAPLDVAIELGNEHCKFIFIKSNSSSNSSPNIDAIFQCGA